MAVFFIPFYGILIAFIMFRAEALLGTVAELLKRVGGDNISDHQPSFCSVRFEFAAAAAARIAQDTLSLPGNIPPEPNRLKP